MRRIPILTAGLLVLTLAWTSVAASTAAPTPATDSSADACCPASSDAAVVLAKADTETLPEGHPSIDKATDEQALPAGHPPMSGAGGQLPAGHPPMSGAGGQLPAGHPPMPGGLNPGAAIGKGTIIVKINQGTKGGAKAIGNVVSLKLIYRGRVINALQSPIAKPGLAMFENVGVTAPAIPIVSVDYGGERYTAIGQTVSPQQPDQVVTLPIFESTDVKPDWKITNRHLILQPMPGGVVVNDIMTVTNPSDHSWTGKLLDKPGPAPANARHKHDHASLVIPLPKNATRIQLAPEFSACCSTMINNQVIHYGPLLPGAHSYRMVYLLPIEKGKVDLPITAAGPTEHIMVFLSDQHLAITAHGMTAGKPMKNEKMSVLTYEASSVKTGQTVSLHIEGLAQGPPAKKQSDAGAIEPQPTPDVVKYLASIGGGLILLLGSITMLSLKAPRQGDPPHPPKP